MQRTHDLHQRLHTHPWISRLASPALTREQYRVLLEAYCGFSAHVESARTALDTLHAFSLAPAVAALERDIAALRGDLDRLPAPPDPSLGDRASLLGALYVLHGSSFGNRVLAKRVRVSLPDAPRDYLGTGTSAALWMRLDAELETHRDNDGTQDRLVRGAMLTFDAFGRFVSHHCSARGVPPEPGRGVVR